MSTVAPQRSSEENPLVEGLERLPVHPTALVIFGATGDLAHRKLLPALYNLAHEGSLPERFELVGVSRSDHPDENFQQIARESIERFSRRKPDSDVLDGLVAGMRYVPGAFDDDNVYSQLEQVLGEFDERAGAPMNRVFYLSTAPQFFPVISQRLGAAGLDHAKKAEVRVVIEKPFGYDLASARQLNAEVLDIFDESQVFRIDHYLGKETVQNLMALRFANALFEPVWNRNFIDHVEISAAEDIGIGGRAGYYEGAGALRDLVQNHMLQLLALLTMEPPASFEANRLRDEKLKVLEAIVPPTTDQVQGMALRAQYGPGVVAGDKVPGYREEEGVADDSRTETYAALRLHVSNWRWAGVPFYLRTGKRLARKVTEIAVTLKPIPHLAFQSCRLGRGTGEPDHPHRAAGRRRVGVTGREDPRPTDANPPGEHGVPLRHIVPVRVARGLRATHPRRDARRRDAVHPQRRDRGAVGDHRPDPHRLARGHRVADRAVSGRVAGTGGGERAARSGTKLAAPVTEDVWSASNTTPDAIDEALRRMLHERHAENHALAPARVLNLIVIVDREWKGEISNRLALVGRYHASRTILCAVEEGRTTLDAWAAISYDEVGTGTTIMHEQVEVDIGPSHLAGIETIVDPIIVSELPTVLWSPHGHEEAVDALLDLTDVVLVDTDDVLEPDAGLARATDLLKESYVVDLAWLRTTPWRERLAASFDPPRAPRRARPSRRDHDPLPGVVASERAAARRLAVRTTALGAEVAARGRARGARRHRTPRGRRGPDRARDHRSGRARSRRRHRLLRRGLRAVARPLARRAARPRTRSRRSSVSGRCSAHRAERAGFSARASARRCCATQPTDRRSAPRGSSARHERRDRNR